MSKIALLGLLMMAAAPTAPAVASVRVLEGAVVHRDLGLPTAGSGAFRMSTRAATTIQPLYWTGYWTWNTRTHAWYWTWIWVVEPGPYTPS